MHKADKTCKCITAFNGEDALNKLLNNTTSFPDLIFLDLNMPKINGKQCLKELKVIEILQDIPVIIYSTSAEKKDILETTELGAAFFLQKPNRFDDLCSALGQLILRNWNSGD